MFRLLTGVFSIDGEDEASLQCNTEKDKGRFRHRTAGKHDSMLTINVTSDLNLKKATSIVIYKIMF